MPYTKESHLAMAAALRKAIPFLWNGVGPYPVNTKLQSGICAALSVRGPSTHTISVQHWIMAQLKGSIYLPGWLSRNGVSYAGYDMPKLQATRLAWMRHMIAVLEAP